jgi:hypothetical protein
MALFLEESAVSLKGNAGVVLAADFDDHNAMLMPGSKGAQETRSS